MKQQRIGAWLAVLIMILSGVMSALIIFGWAILAGVKAVGRRAAGLREAPGTALREALLPFYKPDLIDALPDMRDDYVMGSGFTIGDFRRVARALATEREPPAATPDSDPFPGLRARGYSTNEIASMAADLSAGMATAREPREAGWHGGDICAGPDCPVIDVDGDHPYPDPHGPDWYAGYTEGQRDGRQDATTEGKPQAARCDFDCDACSAEEDNDQRSSPSTDFPWSTVDPDIRAIRPTPEPTAREREADAADPNDPNDPHRWDMCGDWGTDGCPHGTRDAALATEGEPQATEHRPEYQSGAQEHALREVLAEFVVADPWQRATPGEGLVTTDEPWECVGCYAEVPFPEQDSSQPRWWENDGHPDPDDLTPHTALCRWVRGRRALAAEGEP